MTKLFFDLETIPDQSDGALERARDRIAVPKNYRKPEAIEKYKIDHGEEAWKKTGLAGISGEICSIGYAFDDGPIYSVTRGDTIGVDEEHDMLGVFFGTIMERSKDGEGAHQRIEWVGHNLIEFDLRFLKHRCLVLGVNPGMNIPADARHGQGSAYDTMKEWTGFRGYVKQSALQEVFKIEEDKSLSDMDGSQVADYWSAHRFADIGLYNRDDVRVCREIYNRLTWNN